MAFAFAWTHKFSGDHGGAEVHYVPFIIFLSTRSPEQCTVVVAQQWGSSAEAPPSVIGGRPKNIRSFARHGGDYLGNAAKVHLHTHSRRRTNGIAFVFSIHGKTFSSNANLNRLLGFLCPSSASIEMVVPSESVSFAAAEINSFPILRRIFSNRQCAKCGLGLRCDELVMRAKDLVFHVPCFSCSLCQSPLSTGDTAAVQNGQIFCGDHVDLQIPPPPPQIAEEPFYCASPQKGRPRKRKCSPHTPTAIGLSLTHPSLLLLDQGSTTSESLEALGQRRREQLESGTELRLGEDEKRFLVGISEKFDIFASK